VPPNTCTKLPFIISIVSFTALLIATAGCGGTPPVHASPDSAHVAVSSAGLDFGSVAVGSRATAALTVTNVKGSKAILAQVSVAGGAFSFTSSAKIPLSLAAGESAVLTVIFAPTVAGSASGSISVVISGGASPPATSLTGTGLGSSQLGLSPGSMSFGTVSLGTSKSLTGSLTATGSSITISSASSSGAGYSLSGITFPVTVPAGQSVPFTVTFAPQAAGSSAGSVSFVSNASNSPDIEALSGTGLTPSQLGISPTSMSFGTVTLGTSQSQTGTLTASGNNVTISSASSTGAGYSLSGITFPVTVRAGQSVPFTVTFAPQTAGSSTGSVSFVSNASNSPDVEALSGTGLTPSQLGISPTSMNFGTVLLGTSQSQTGTLTASGSNVTVSSASWNGAGYSLGGITFPVTVPAGQSIPFTVTFAPQTQGSSTGSVSFLSNASNSPDIEALSGSGQHNVTLAWDASPSTVAGYNVYRGTTTGGPYAKLTSSAQPGLTYLDASVTAGANYFYVITAVDASSQESAFSSEVMAVIPTP